MSLAEHDATHGEAPSFTRRGAPELIDALDAAGLRGRGGSGFPTATKLRAVAAAGSRRGAAVVANGTESEPASGKDAALMAYAPHLVIDGLSMAAVAVGATAAILCVKESSADALSSLEVAAAEREGRDRTPVEIVSVPAGYVAGEESALINLLNTGASLPTLTPPLPFERGVGGLPTLVQNVETLAHVALIARHGPDWFRVVGSADDPGSALVTVGGAVESPGVFEIATGTPLESLVTIAGGSYQDAHACLVGGYGGTWVEARRSAALPLSRSMGRDDDAGLGPGIVHVLPRGRCGLHETAMIARYLAEQSAGQCGPCRFGLPAIADALEDIAAGAARPGTNRWIRRWSEQVQGRGACHHPDGATRMVRSALRVFADDLTSHETGEGCLHEVAMSVVAE